MLTSVKLRQFAGRDRDGPTETLTTRFQLADQMIRVAPIWFTHSTRNYYTVFCIRINELAGRVFVRHTTTSIPVTGILGIQRSEAYLHVDMSDTSDHLVPSEHS